MKTRSRFAWGLGVLVVCGVAVVGALNVRDDINAVASWIAAQPLPANTRPAAAPPAWAAGMEALTCGSGLAAPGLPGSKAQQ